MKPTLFLLAAGMGSRYGGLKQLDGLGPNGETIMDYSIYDAINAGFGKLVFVIRKDFEQDFREKIISKYIAVNGRLLSGVLYWAIGAVVYYLYDYAMTLIITFYMERIHNKIK